ncbi:hypothetical protein OTU49_010476, partial [Cherax quadricarinatus]
MSSQQHPLSCQALQQPLYSTITWPRSSTSSLQQQQDCSHPPHLYCMAKPFYCFTKHQQVFCAVWPRTTHTTERVDGLARALFSGVLTCPGHQDLPVTPVLSALMHPPYTPPSHTPPSHTPRAHTPTGQTPPPHTPPPISVAAKIMGVGSFSSMDVAPASSAGNSRRPNKDAPI